MDQKSKTSNFKRKTPQQKRSQGVVEAIFTATTQVLKTVGYEAATTNSIAERAGVSVGSLYQYFSGKRSLVTDLMERGIRQMTEEFLRTVDRCEGLPLESAIEKLTRHAIDAFLGDRIKTRAVYERLPEFKLMPVLFESRRRIVLQVAELLRKSNRPLAVADPELAIFVVINGTMGVIHTMIFDDGSTYDNGRLVRELSDQAIRYLLK